MLNCTVQVLKLSEFKDLQYIYTPCILKKKNFKDIITFLAKNINFFSNKTLM